MSDATIHLPPRLAQWSSELAAASAKFGVPPSILAAIMDRESLGGEALKPVGPAGTGDTTPREIGGRYKVCDVYKPAVLRRQDRLLPAVLPADGGGWGRGLMQLDFAWHQDFCRLRDSNGKLQWQDPLANILEGTRIFKEECLDRLDGNIEAAIAAYNAGAKQVRKTLQDITKGASTLAVRAALDALTTGGEYVTDVLHRATVFTTVSLEG